jgi:hypothetical protein
LQLLIIMILFNKHFSTKSISMGKDYKFDLTIRHLIVFRKLEEFQATFICEDFL